MRFERTKNSAVKPVIPVIKINNTKAALLFNLGTSSPSTVLSLLLLEDDEDEEVILEPSLAEER